MEFRAFAKKLKTVIGGTSNTKKFTKTLFETMMNDSGPALLESTSPDTFKAYFNGNTSISNIAALVLANLNDEDEFPSYLDEFGETTAQLLADEFAGDIEGINTVNASTKVTDLFLEILRETSGKKKSTPKSVKKDIEIESIEIPEEQPLDEYPYSQDDKLLLQEFTTDYDEIMFTMISENYATSLLDMTLSNKIQELYNTKWSSKSAAFTDPTLKSYIFGLLGELNTLSTSLLDGNEPFFIKQTRTKIRNLYVKLHPDLFAGTFPYDAFIDDWNDGEF